MPSVTEPAVRALAQRSIEQARLAAIRKHGQLKGGMKRWIHHLREECEEAVAEMVVLDSHPVQAKERETRINLIIELGQVAQLAQSMMVMLYMGNEKEGEETWEQYGMNSNGNQS